MANVNLKTDFKDGEFLYAEQLKNNFEAIQAALNAMNAIVWQDNADKVVTFRGTTEELMNREIIDGQILYDTNTGESYIDYLGKRISTGSGNAIHIGDTEPTNPSTQIWINRDDLSAVGSEVVNSLEGNEEKMAPSVAAVNKNFAPNDYTSLCNFVNCTFNGGAIYKIGRIVFVQVSITSNVTAEWEQFIHIPDELVPLSLSIDGGTKISGTDFWVYTAKIVRGTLQEGVEYSIVGAYLAKN